MGESPGLWPEWRTGHFPSVQLAYEVLYIFTRLMTSCPNNIPVIYHLQVPVVFRQLRLFIDQVFKSLAANQLSKLKFEKVGSRTVSLFWIVVSTMISEGVWQYCNRTDDVYCLKYHNYR